MNSAQRFEQAMDIFQRACDLPAEERDAFLAEACLNDPDLRADVESLLRHDQIDSDAVLAADSGGSAKILADSVAWDTPETLPETIGNFRILRRISSGGMGVVYEAQQDQPNRRVAIKVIRTAFTSPEMMRRFQREAQMLGWLQHRGIAHIYQAGSAAVGNTTCPYIAMELIDGEPIDAHARNAKLDTRERMELIARVCDAVQHAHQKGVMHRDLKPANILIVVERTAGAGSDDGPSRVLDRIGQPKVLDFGVARATDHDMQATTLQTHAGQIVGTLGYMSPEQIAGNSAELDTRCDVYAIGAILYLLLADRLPFDLAGLPVVEAARIIREEEPAKLGSIMAGCRGDIETIVGKALEKDKEKRYPSAAELATDIRRFLDHEPIMARPAGALYQFAKFTRRNKALVGGAAATFVALLIGLSLATFGFVMASQERDAANRERDAKQEALRVADEVTAFLAEMLAAASPARQGRDVTVREVLDNAASGIEARFAEEPLVEAALRSTIGETYIALGEFDKAEEQYADVLDLRTRIHGEDSEETMAALNSLATAHYYQGRITEAVEEFALALQGFQKHFEQDDPRLVEVMANLAFMRMRLGQFGDAEPLLSRAVAIQQRAAGVDDPMLLDLRQNLAQMFGWMGRRDEAVQLYEDVIERSNRVRGAEHPQTILAMANLAQMHLDIGPEKAIPALREVLELQKRVLGEDHSQTLITLGNLATAFDHAGKYQEAEPLLREGLAHARQAYGNEHPRTLRMLAQLGYICSQLDKTAEAKLLLTECVESAKDDTIENRDTTNVAMRDLIQIYVDSGEFERAAPIVEELVERTNDLKEARPTDWMEARVLSAQCKIGLDQFEQAEKELLSFQEDGREIDAARVTGALVQLYDAWHKPDKAAKWRQTEDGAGAQ